MQVYDTLYKRDENGNIREWRMEREGNAYRSVSGIQGGKLVTSEWKPVEGKGIGKGYRDPETQADSEIKSKYKKQLDTQYHADVKNIDTEIKFDPMLAKKYLGFDGPRWSQPKLDGIRAIATASELRSRAGKKIVSCPHIEQALAEFFKRHPDAILDGELYNHSLKEDFNKITSCVKKTKPKDEDMIECAKYVQYWVYDVPSEGDRPFSERAQWLEDNLPEGQFGIEIHESYIVLIETTHCATEEEFDNLNVSYLVNGYEGQMGRLDEPYENKRTKSLEKRKEFIDAEFPLIAKEEGEGNWAGAVKSVKCTLPSGQTFSAGVKGKRERGRELVNEDHDLVTIRFFRLTPDGIPRFGVCTAFYNMATDIENRRPTTQSELDELIADISKESE